VIIAKGTPGDAGADDPRRVPKTRQPRLARWIAQAWPMPEDAPVINTTFCAGLDRRLAFDMLLSADFAY
jgi:hypothetical protein